MPAKVTDTAFLNAVKRGTKGSYAKAANEKAPAQGNLPGGLIRCVAQLVDITTGLTKEKDPYIAFQCAVLEEGDFQGMKFSVSHFLAESQYRTSLEASQRLTADLQRLGIETEGTDESDLLKQIALLKKTKPIFRFDTRAWNYEGKNGVTIQITGVAEDYEANPEDSEAVEASGEESPIDDTPELETLPTIEEVESMGKQADDGNDLAIGTLTALAETYNLDPDSYDTWAGLALAIVSTLPASDDPEPEGEEYSDGGADPDSGDSIDAATLETLGADADTEDESAIETLTGLATAAELDPNDYPTWAELAEALKAYAPEPEPEEEPEEEIIPEIGYEYMVVFPRARKPRAADCMAVNKAAQTATVKDADGVTVVGVAFSKFSYCEEDSEEGHSEE